MRHKNDGKGRLGGRTAGTSNKVTGEMKIWLVELINQNRATLEADLKALDGRDRWQIVEKLMSYCIPKMSISDLNLTRMSEDELQALTDQILSNLKDDGTENTD